MLVRFWLVAIAALSLTIFFGCNSNVSSGGSSMAPEASSADTENIADKTDFPGNIEGAKSLITELSKETNREGARVLRPKDDDYAAVFDLQYAYQAREGYNKLWNSHRDLPMTHNPELTELHVWKATTEELRDGSGDSHKFNEEWHEISMKLKPGVNWYCWKHCQPGTYKGLGRDGLVFVNGHWAIFPEPWWAFKSEAQ